ncbi:hypothetical protein HY450_02430 [Candidatus Pacearchaeota archaeon]|nr:hypothetical protein [Candidatus Pacearchaeota archaeon]
MQENKIVSYYKNKKSVDIVFTGLIRKKDIFKKSINDLLEIRKAGLADRIILSTWFGETKEDREMLNFLNKNGVEILESKEPEDKGPGNIWCQMKALEAALQEISSEKFVLKTRADVYINPEFLKKLFSQKDKLLKIESHLPKGDLFQHKVWVIWYEITRPFYIADECFFGHKNDLKLLINYDKSLDEEYTLGAGKSHVRRFAYPFLNDYPIIKDSFGKYNDWNPTKVRLRDFLTHKINLRGFKPLKKLNEYNRFRLLRKKLSDENYIEMLAVYYSIMNSHFYVDGDSFPNQVTFNESTAPRVKLDAENFENNLTKEKTVIPLGGQIHDFNNDLLKNICSGKIEKTDLGEKLIKAVEKFNNPNNSKI